MSARQTYVRPAHKPDPELVAQGLRMIATMLDSADERIVSTYDALFGQEETKGECADAWAAIAIILADHGEIDTPTLKEMARTIYNVSQDVIPGT